jgi:predicted CxxxxCH...CXXCH cytochrome family protein
MRPQSKPLIVLAALLLAVASLLTSCSDLKSSLPAASTSELKVHDEGWNTSTSPNFHGKVLAQADFKLDDCATCHSKQFTGGVSGVSCYQCHQVYPHAANFASTSGHPQFIAGHSYSLTDCQKCHGTDYAGSGDTRLSCTNAGCHVDATNAPKTPEACNTCHGTFTGAANDLASAAPPRGLGGETQTSSRAVGAHQAHVKSGALADAMQCQECHTVPTQLTSSGHLGTLPAEVMFNGTLGRLATGGTVPNPAYSSTSLKCSNTYCHGNWKLQKATSTNAFIFTEATMEGNNASPAWTGGTAEVACGSCHGIPPKGHLAVPLSTCGTCHDGVASPEGTILDTKKHMNGKINVFAQEYAF